MLFVFVSGKSLFNVLHSDVNKWIGFCLFIKNKFPISRTSFMANGLDYRADMNSIECVRVYAGWCMGVCVLRAQEFRIVRQCMRVTAWNLNEAFRMMYCYTIYIYMCCGCHGNRCFIHSFLVFHLGGWILFYPFFFLCVWVCVLCLFILDEILTLAAKLFIAFKWWIHWASFIPWTAHAFIQRQAHQIASN